MNWLSDYPFIAHRGLHDLMTVENTEKAFIDAIDRQYAIELDIQFLKNGTAIVFHDETLERLLNSKTNVKSVNPKFIQFLKYSDGQRVLSLDNALEIIDGKVPLLIEIKRESFENRFLKKLTKQLSLYKGRFSLQSFDPIVLKKVKMLGPNLNIGQLVTNWGSANINMLQTLYMESLNYLNDFDFLAVDSKILNSSHILISKKKNIPLISWTIRSVDEFDKVKNKTQGVIFENFLP